MLLLPFVLSVVIAFAMAPALLEGLRQNGAVTRNYRGVELPCPLGLLIPASAIIAFGPLSLIALIADDARPLSSSGVGLVLGVALLGLADDLLSGPSRGWRGHAKAVRAGSFSTGILKAVGTLGIAAAFANPLQSDHVRYVLDVLVIVLATNLFNIVDLRPGRAEKLFALVAIGLMAGAWDADRVASFGIFAGPIVVAAMYDLRERGMLGDTGANVIGVVAGVWLIQSLSLAGLAVTVGVLLAVTAYGEFRSISGFVERTPGFRHLDSLGREPRA